MKRKNIYAVSLVIRTEDGNLELTGCFVDTYSELPEAILYSAIEQIEKEYKLQSDSYEILGKLIIKH